MSPNKELTIVVYKQSSSKNSWAENILYFRIARKVAGYLGEVLEEQRDKLQENLLANGSE